MSVWLVASAASVVLWILWLRWRNASIKERALAGRRALASGDLDEAAAIFEELRREPAAATMARELLAWTRMRQERLADAIAVELEQHERDTRRPSAGALPTKLELARLHALRADLPAARQWADDARRLAERARGVNRRTADAQLLVVDALIACREGAPDAARALLLRDWGRFETLEGGGGWRAEACLLRGFLDGAAGAGVEVWLGLDEASRARVRWMSAEWPELRAFLDAYDR